MEVDKPFIPFAVFDNDLDSVLVITKDCSYEQIKINEALAILAANYYEEIEDKYIGFEICGVRHFCATYNLHYSGKTDLVELLEVVMARFPCPLNYQDEMYRMMIEVDSVKLP